MRSRRIQILFAFSIASGLLFYQNCTRVSFNRSGLTLEESTLASLGIKHTLINTKKNHSIDFKIGADGNRQGSLSFASTPGNWTLKSANGTFNVIDPLSYQMRYTPDHNFVGSETITVYVTDDYGTSAAGEVQVIVGNIINELQPALAVRGIGCMSCHADVRSNIITDYGLGGNGHGHDYYFEQIPLDSLYADRADGLNTLNLSSTSKLILPRASVPTQIANTYGVSNLVDYARGRLATSVHPGARTAAVVEVEKVEIRIPNANRLRQAFGFPSSAYLYDGDVKTSPALSGLNYEPNKKLFTVQNMTCDGDLFLEGTVLLKNASISSVTGCRLYVTGSVFIQGELLSKGIGGSDQHNVQIVSARSIWSGNGVTKKDGAYCDTPTSWVVQNQAAASFELRIDHFNVRKTPTRAFGDFENLAALVRQERAQLPEIQDAACTPKGRAIERKRLLLAAPVISDRYNGNFSGAIIAEVALTALGTFKFEFDPTFRTVSIFSKLESNELVNIEGSIAP